MVESPVYSTLIEQQEVSAVFAVKSLLSIGKGNFHLEGFVKR